MADDVVLNAATRNALQILQGLQGAAQGGLKQAVENEKAVADLVEEAREDLARATATRGRVVNIKA